MSDFSMLTIRQAAKKSGVTEYYIRNRVKNGTIPGFYSGKKFLVNYPAFVDMIKKECIKHE